MFESGNLLNIDLIPKLETHFFIMTHSSASQTVGHDAAVGCHQIAGGKLMS